jgi:hypothetical protein
MDNAALSRFRDFFLVLDRLVRETAVDKKRAAE